MLPLQSDGDELVIAIEGTLTVTVTVPIEVHPVAFCEVTVYVVLLVGVAITIAPVVVFKPVEGDQL